MKINNEKNILTSFIELIQPDNIKFNKHIYNEEIDLMELSEELVNLAECILRKIDFDHNSFVLDKEHEKYLRDLTKLVDFESQIYIEYCLLVIEIIKRY